MLKHLRILALFTITASLLSCGGGDGNTITRPPGDDTGGGGGGGGVLTVQLGSGTPPNFSPGQIGIQVPSLAAGGSTSLSVSLVRSDDTLYTQPVDVTFSSACLANGLANLTTNPVSTTTGVATTTYSATGCSGDDVITASTITAGTALSATGTVTVAAAQVGSIEFISASPSLIGLKGTGGVGISETSTVVFRVVDSTGGPVQGADVDFSLDSSVGGVALSPATATSGSDGRVQTVVQSGTVATTVRVNANVVGLSIGTQSSELVVTTGLPDQDSFSLSVTCPNVEAFDIDGVNVEVTARLADRFGNPVPDGTAVTLTAEGGKIGGSCTTITTSGAASESGVCTVNWTSQNPRPANGRASLLATAIGEETFTDANGNGIFDDPDSFVDLDEPFRDDNENGGYDVGEFFLDFDNSSSFTTGDGQFNGLLCADTTGRCSASEKTAISAGNLIIMSGSAAVITPNTLQLNAPGTLSVRVGDARNQPMPAGTTVSAEVTNGKLVGPSEYEVPCTSVDSPLTFTFTVEADGTPSSGLLFITVETPRGLLSTRSVTIID